MILIKNLYALFFCLIAIVWLPVIITAQNKLEILSGADLKLVVPTGFYFAGQSAETQIRNSAAAKIGENRYIVAGLVDTSGYSTEISGKYEGFFITDSPVKIGGKTLNTGAYGFGFATDKINIFDLSSKQILSAPIINDSEIKRPRPLMMSAEAKGIRFYKGKNYALITAK